MANMIMNNDKKHLKQTNDEGTETTSISCSPTTVSNISEPAMNSEYIPLNVTEDAGNRVQRSGRILNRRALIAFLAVTVLAIAIVSVTVIFVVYSDNEDDVDERKTSRDATKPSDSSLYTFDDINSWKYSPNVPNDKWISDNTLLSIDDGGNIISYNVDKQTKTTLVTKESLDSAFSDNVLLSPDKQWMLLMVDKKRKYRYSNIAKYIAKNIDTGDSVNINTSGRDDDDPSLVQYISWGSHENCIVFVSNNDIYYKRDIKDSPTIRLTSDGEEKIFFNGITDWVYEEEVLADRPALVISQNQKYVSYATFNDTEVPLYHISMYEGIEKAYTKIQDIAYPKAGYPNPVVHIYVHDVNTNTRIEIYPPYEFGKKEYYFTNLMWADSSTISVTWLNRAQDTTVHMLCSANDGSCDEIYRYKVEDGWISQKYLNPIFSADGSYYLQVLPKDDNYLHIAVISSKKQSDVKFITSGSWDVKKIVKFDEKNSLVYYESSGEKFTQKHIYSVGLTSGKMKCLTCSINETKAGNCKMYSADFSEHGSWYLLKCLGPSVPKTWIKNAQSQEAMILEDNESLQKKLSKLSLPTTKDSMIRTTDGKYEILLREMFPPNFDENKKYAVIFSVYGGPGSQAVFDIFNLGLNTYLTSNFDVIVCELDGRGTDSRGRKFVQTVQRQLGVFERDDTLAAARYMQTKKYVDPKRLSIWGWSYGGFLSSFILSTQDDQIFGSAIAVAPVTDWRYYDSIYTERFMGQPTEEDNILGYNYSSVLNHAKNIPSNSFLLVHGTGDDNVHFQNSVQLIRVMSEAGIQFETQIYTDKHHGLEGLNIQKHLYHRLTDFFKDKLQL